MKMFLATFFTFMPMAFAAGHQCPQPGQVLNREFLQMNGETVTQNFSRSGSTEVSRTGKFQGELSSKISKVFKETYCKETQEKYQEEVCLPVDLNAALGRGNLKFTAFFDLSNGLLKRAEIFAQSVQFYSTQPAVERLEISKQVISLMGKYAATAGIPKSWEGFSGFLTQGVAEGIILQSVADEILTVNGEKNKLALGFSPLPGASVSEGKGNGKLPTLFSLQSSVQIRADLIQTTLEGVSDKAALTLSVSFIQFAAANGIPENWNQFIVMMKAIRDGGSLSADDFTSITASYEDANRLSLGFDLTAKSCKMEDRVRTVNLLQERKVEDFFQTAKKTFSVDLMNGALLSGEKETYSVNFDGFNNLTFSFSDSYNTYKVTAYKDEQGVVAMVVDGTRKLVTPPSNIAAKVLRDGKLLNVRVQNKLFNAGVGGHVIVKIDFYEQIPFWPDFKLATKTFELSNGESWDVATKVAARNVNRKIRLDVSMQIVGSPYYNDLFSDVVEIKE